jgi:hypothetical protein
LVYKYTIGQVYLTSKEKTMNDRIKAYANFISKQVNEGVIKEDAKSDHAMSPKVQKYESEPVSKGDDHEIRFTAGDDNDFHYHGHVGGKKFTVTSREVGGDDDQSAETNRAKSDFSNGLKAQGISGAHHDKALKAIMGHAKKEINATYNGE